MARGWTPLLLTALLVTLPWGTCGEGVITMLTHSVVVREGEMFDVTVRKAGTANSAINVVVEVG